MLPCAAAVVGCSCLLRRGWLLTCRCRRAPGRGRRRPWWLRSACRSFRWQRCRQQLLSSLWQRWGSGWGLMSISAKEIEGIVRFFFSFFSSVRKRNVMFPMANFPLFIMLLFCPPLLEEGEYFLLCFSSKLSSLFCLNFRVSRVLR